MVLGEAQCRKLGIPCKTTNTAETSLGELHRHNRNLRKLKQKAQQQLHIENVQSIPDAPPLSDESSFKNAMDRIRGFELKQIPYNAGHCSVCQVQHEVINHTAAFMTKIL